MRKSKGETETDQNSQTERKETYLVTGETERREENTQCESAEINPHRNENVEEGKQSDERQFSRESVEEKRKLKQWK